MLVSRRDDYYFQLMFLTLLLYVFSWSYLIVTLCCTTLLNWIHACLLLNYIHLLILFYVPWMYVLFLRLASIWFVICCTTALNWIHAFLPLNYQISFYRVSKVLSDCLSLSCQKAYPTEAIWTTWIKKPTKIFLDREKPEKTKHIWHMVRILN